MADELRFPVLERYARTNVPRYTSYPTAPNFSASIDAFDYRNWLGALPESNASLYLHVPFCRAMCWYCGCHTTVAGRASPVTRYVSALAREVRLVADEIAGPLLVRHLHFGGGTPTLMAPGELRFLMTELRRAFSLSEDAEIAVEIDPRTLTADMAEVLGECGFNRASLGVQSFDPVVQQAINRVQGFDQVAAALRLLRRNGIDKVNFDLIYGLPHETLESCLRTVDQALQLTPDRIAVYGYAHVPSFKPHQRKIDAAALPGPEARFTHSRAIADAFVLAGYEEIGLDHFALPDDPLAIASAEGRLHRNFQGYTTDQAEVLIGLGASAIGRMPQGFVQNTVRIGDYQRLIGEGRLPTARGYAFAGDDRLRGALIERLMCDHEVDVGALCRRFGADPAPLIRTSALGRLMADGLVTMERDRIVMTPSARPLVRTVAAAFDAHLDRCTGRSSHAV